MIERGLDNLEKYKEVPQGEIIYNLKEDESIVMPINYGACIGAITKSGDEYVVGHFQPGEIVNELIALLDAYGLIKISQSSFKGSVKDFFESTQEIKNKKQIKRMFKERDNQAGLM